MLTLLPTEPNRVTRKRIEQRLRRGDQKGKDIAREFGVTEACISNIRRRMGLGPPRWAPPPGKTEQWAYGMRKEQARRIAQRIDMLDFVGNLMLTDGLTWEQTVLQMGGLSGAFKDQLARRYPELRPQLKPGRHPKPPG